jgi:hypothetical protein
MSVIQTQRLSDLSPEAIQALEQLYAPRREVCMIATPYIYRLPANMHLTELRKNGWEHDSHIEVIKRGNYEK